MNRLVKLCHIYTKIEWIYFGCIAALGASADVLAYEHDTFRSTICLLMAIPVAIEGYKNAKKEFESQIVKNEINRVKKVRGF